MYTTLPGMLLIFKLKLGSLTAGESVEHTQGYQVSIALFSMCWEICTHDYSAILLALKDRDHI